MIDIFKMDIEGPERLFIQKMDIDYACRYFKQFLFETHIEYDKVPKVNFERYNLLMKLEKCFLLFHRDTRFFKVGGTDKNGWLNEFQIDHKINLRQFGANEIEVIWYMLSIGELYFVNKNFL